MRQHNNFHRFGGLMMRQSGFIFSYDVAVSAAIVVLALAVLMQAMEVAAYAEQESLMREELENAAITASALMVGSPENTCGLQDTKGNPFDVHIPNCVVLDSLTKGSLGLGGTYGCMVEDGAGTIINVSGCSGPPPGNRDVFVVERIVLAGGANETRAGLAGLDEETLRLMVWRNN